MWKALEKAQRVESAKLQVKAFHAKKRNALSNSGVGQLDKNAPAPKVGRGMGGVKSAGAARGSLARRAASGRGQSRVTSQESSVSTSQMGCGYCEKSNHTADDCWRKVGKCLSCGNAEHQIANCPMARQAGGGSQQSARQTSK